MGNSEHEMKNVKWIRPIFSSANSWVLEKNIFWFQPYEQIKEPKLIQILWMVGTNFLSKNREIVCRNKKMHYICTRNWEIAKWCGSSAG